MPYQVRQGDLETGDYNVMLMDDHPLRSYPTECIPGLSIYMGEWYTAAKKNATERVFRYSCVFLVILYVNFGFPLMRSTTEILISILAA